MRTVLIAHRDIAFAESLAEHLRPAGFRVIVCPGPWRPARCIRCDVGYCPLTEGADLMVYDPGLTAPAGRGERHTLAVESALAHPDVPLLLAWSPDTVPHAGTLRGIRSSVPWAGIAAREPAAFVRQVVQLLSGAGLRRTIRAEWTAPPGPRTRASRP